MPNPPARPPMPTREDGGASGSAGATGSALPRLSGAWWKPQASQDGAASQSTGAASQSTGATRGSSTLEKSPPREASGAAGSQHWPAATGVSASSGTTGSAPVIPNLAACRSARRDPQRERKKPHVQLPVVCWQFMLGICKRGPRCKYSHKWMDVSTKLSPLPYDNAPGDVNITGTIKIVIHVAGAAFGGIPAKCAATLYVGDGSDLASFSDPHEMRRGQCDYDSNCPIDNRCDGQNGFIQLRLLQVGLSQGQMANWAEAIQRDPDLPIRRFTKAVGEVFPKVVKQAIARHEAGDPAIGHIRVVCKRGRHRSTACAKFIQWTVDRHGFGSGLRLHHCRVIPDVDNRGECGCGGVDAT